MGVALVLVTILGYSERVFAGNIVCKYEQEQVTEM